jgi:hypothetical protein
LSALCHFRSTLIPPSRSTSFQGFQRVDSCRLMARTDRSIQGSSGLFRALQGSEDKKIKKIIQQIVGQGSPNPARDSLSELRLFRSPPYAVSGRMPTASHPSTTMNRPGTLPAPANRYSQLYPCRRNAIRNPTRTRKPLFSGISLSPQRYTPAYPRKPCLYCLIAVVRPSK